MCGKGAGALVNQSVKNSRLMEEQEHIVEKNPHLFKIEYEYAQVEELMEWFEARMEQLPQTLQLNPATSTRQLPETVKSLIAVIKARDGKLDVTFNSYVSHLLLIRMRLKEQGME